MKSKTLRKGTRRRRLRRNVKKTKTKRGGMFHGAMSVARSKMGTTLYHKILPLFTRFNTIFGKDPTPEQKAIVLKGERYFRSGADFPVDNAVRASINKSIEEWSRTEQTAEKALGFYNKIIQTLKDAEKRRQPKQGLKIQRPDIHTLSSPLRESLASIVPMSLRNEQLLRTPGNSSNTDTPQQVSRDEKGSQSVLTPRSFAPTIHNPRGDTTVQHLSFDGELGPDTTPPTSPDKITSPPRLPPKSRGPFSPSRRLVLP